MPVLTANPAQQKLLKQFANELSQEMNRIHPKYTDKVDFGMLSVPLVGLAVHLLKERGLSREEIGEMIMATVERQFEGSAALHPLLDLRH